MNLKISLLNHSLSRLFSLGLASGLSILIFIYPLAVADPSGQAQHSLLMVLMLAICIGFFHGVGFEPQRIIWQIILGPLLCWPIMLFALFRILI